MWLEVLRGKLKPQGKEKHRELLHDGTRGLHVNQQGVLRQERIVRQACGLRGSAGNRAVNRCPLGVISTNVQTNVNGNHRGREPSVTFTSSSGPSSSTGLENEGSLMICNGNDLEGSADIWDVIIPGNTKEKIAIFASQMCSNKSAHGAASETKANISELRTVKSKCCWAEDCSVPKRRRRSGNVAKSKVVMSNSPKPQFQGALQQEPLNENMESFHGSAMDPIRNEGIEHVKSPSVVEMVAYFEQRASDQHVCSKPVSLPSSTTTLCKSAVVLQTEEQQILESVQLQVLEGHEESIRVLDMVAKLESQCLKRQSFVENGGDLSRNSLRRKVGRVLLAGSQSYPLPVSPTVNRDCEVECVVQVMGGDAGNLKSTCNTFETIKCGLDCSSISRKVSSKAVETETIFQSSKDAVSNCSEEPLPGMLFFAKSYLQPIKEQHFSDSKSNSQNEGPFQLCKHTADPFKAENERFEETMEEETALGNQEPVPFPLHRIVSHEFLETRFKIQLLLEPQQYMASLPHHIILKIFCLLPTQSLVALKCTCNYFKFIIERYCIRPADCQWVIDPRYKDDPCKQCKKRYNHGDISLCRWHHKPYCQALPYGPGYWMCCRRAHKDSPGCNVGLHDNRWVPALSRHTNLQGQLGQW